MELVALIVVGLVVYVAVGWYVAVVTWSKIRHNDYPDMFDAGAMGVFWPFTVPGYAVVKSLMWLADVAGKSVEKGAEWRG